MPEIPKLPRRSFCKGVIAAAPFAAAPASSAPNPNEAAGTASAASEAAPAPADESTADLIIVGGGFGGCAAALAAARHGLTVLMTEETDWIGGQLTSQAVPPDENPWVETFGATRSYQDLRTRIRDYYRRNYPLTAAARAQPYLNPGGGGVSRLCHEPRVALAALNEMLAPFVSAGRVRVLPRHVPVSASTEGDRVESVRVRSLESGRELVLHGPMFVDATETGELLPLTGTEYVTGAEARSETGEPHAAEVAGPQNMQAATLCFPLEYLHGEDFTIDRPEEWEFWRDFVPQLSPPWPGKLFSFVYSHPATLKPRDYGFDAEKGTGFFYYRRIVDRRNFAPGTFAGDVTLVNWPMNDYLLGNSFECPPEEAARHLARARQMNLALLYWLQTEAPRADGGTGWKGLRLRPDLVGTEDGMAKALYIRESRRIRAEFTVVEQHVGTDARMEATGAKKEDVLAEAFPDSVGIGSYRIDLHPSTGGDNYIDIGSLPFQIPLGALLPRRVENLLPACKNLGVTHITNGCYRLHPVEWNIGEAVGALAAFCAKKKKAPREVRKHSSLLREFQSLLTRDGVPLSWPKATPR